MLAAAYSVVMCGAWPVNLTDLTVASSRYDPLLGSDTLLSDMPHVSELLVPGFGRPRCHGPEDGGIRTRWMRRNSPTPN